MAPRKRKVASKAAALKKAVNPWDVTCFAAPRGSVKVIARPCPNLDVVDLGKRKARSDDAVELCKDGTQQVVSLNIQDGRHKSKAKNQNQFKLPWVAPETTQADMYNTVKPVIDKFLAQRTCDCALLAYGATGSGKTYSMQGPKRVYLAAMEGVAPNTVDEEEGILQRCLQHVFKRPSDSSAVCICAVEIYKEKIRDLLVPGARWGDRAAECEIMSLDSAAADIPASADRPALTGQVALRHKNKTPLREVKVHSVHSAMHALSNALQSRTCRETKKNAESSRSHMLIGVSLCKPPLQAQLDGVESRELTKMATLWLGDLCGAESYDLMEHLLTPLRSGLPVLVPVVAAHRQFWQRKAAGSQQQAETRAINQSLLSFTSCLHTLWRNQQHGERGVPPTRDSSLTRILADAMRGIGHLALTTHFSLRDADVESTRRTLAFAAQVAELQFEVGTRLHQTVLLEGDGAGEPVSDVSLTHAQAAGAHAGAERRAAADRRAREMQTILEHPALLRQRDQLAAEVAQLKQIAVEREQAAFDEGREEGVQAGREEVGGQGDDDGAAAELLNLANEDWQLRLEEAVHEAKRKMHAQMCAQVEEITERNFQKEAELNREIVTLRGQLRRAGLLQRTATQMPRRTLVRARSPGTDSDSDEDDAGCGGVCVAGGPAVIQEEDEESGAGGTGDDRSGADSSGEDEEEEETPGEGDLGADAVAGPAELARSGGAARSVTVAGDGVTEDVAARIKQQQLELETLRADLAALQQTRDLQSAALQQERDAVLERDRKVQQEMVALRRDLGEVRAEREQLVRDASSLKAQLTAMTGRGETATEPPGVLQTASDRPTSRSRDAVDDTRGGHDDGPEAEISLERYQQVLQEAMAEASDEEAGDAEAGDVKDVDDAAAAGAGLAAEPAAGPPEAAGASDRLAAMVAAGSPSPPSSRPGEVAEGGSPAAACGESSDDFGNVSFAPPVEPAGALDASRSAQGEDGGENASAGMGDCAADESAHGGIGRLEGGSSEAEGGGACGAVAVEEAVVVKVGQARDVAGGGAVAAQDRAALRQQRTDLQRLLAGVPLPTQAVVRKDVLLGAGQRLGTEEEKARRWHGRQAAAKPGGEAVEVVASALEMSHAGADDENRGRAGGKGRVTRQTQNHVASNIKMGTRALQPAQRALRARRNQ